MRDRGDTDAIEAFNHPHPGAKGQPVIHRHAWGLTPHSHILRAVCCEPECLEFPTHNIHPTERREKPTVKKGTESDGPAT